MKYCELLPQDQTMFKDILAQMFFHCPPDPIPDELLRNALEDQCNKNNLEGTAHFLSKVQQLYDMMDLSDGVMLLGRFLAFCSVSLQFLLPLHQLEPNNVYIQKDSHILTQLNQAFLTQRNRKTLSTSLAQEVTKYLPIIQEHYIQPMQGHLFDDWADPVPYLLCKKALSLS